MLSAKLCLITGAASGIGKSVCETFLNAGARIIAVDQNKTALAQLLQNLEDDRHQTRQVFQFATDVSCSESVDKLISDVVGECLGGGDTPPPSVLVNAAGITRDSWFLKQSEKQFDEVIGVNLKGTFLVSQRFSQLLVKSCQAGTSSGGSIINVSSLSGKRGNIGQANYSASKAGVQGLTRTVAQELAKFNIRCNAVLPGYITTPMTETVPEKIQEQVKSLIPMQRFGTAQEVADLCLYLASDKSSYITGASIDVNGGLCMA